MIADNLRALMEQKGLNQSMLAARAGITQAEISRILSGHRGERIHFNTVLALADALGVDPRLLAGRPVRKASGHK